MFRRWDDFDDTYALLNSFRNQVDRFFHDFETGVPAHGDAGPRLNLFDAGAAFVLTADVPGLSENDLAIDVTQDVFTLRGERRVDAPEGYAAHRRERGHYRFSRSFSLPARVDLERATATVKDGTLRVELPKAAEARPRQIAVRAS
jgi:HSP20 family protein